MKLDKAVAALEAASAKRRVRVAEAEGKADKLRTKLRRARQREAPTRKWLPPDIIRIALLAGSGASIGEIASAMGTTRPRMSSVMRHHSIPVVPRRSSEVVLRLTVPRTSADGLRSIAVDRDLALEVLAADLLVALAAEPVVAANLIDDAG